MHGDNVGGRGGEGGKLVEQNALEMGGLVNIGHLPHPWDGVKGRGEGGVSEEQNTWEVEGSKSVQNRLFSKNILYS